MSIKKLAIFSAAILILAAPSAQAGGLIGDLINNVAPGVGTQLDRMNHNLGNPVDHAAAAAANAIVPGSGAAMEAYYAYNKGGVPGLIQQQTGIPMGGQPGIVAPPVAPQGGYANAGFQQPMFGNRCYTQFGVSGPGMPAPVGSPCNVMGPTGPIFGQVGI